MVSNLSGDSISLKYEIKCQESGRFSITVTDGVLASLLALSFRDSLVHWYLSPHFLDLYPTRHRGGSHATVHLVHLGYL